MSNADAMNRKKLVGWNKFWKMDWKRDMRRRRILKSLKNEEVIKINFKSINMRGKLWRTRQELYDKRLTKINF